MARKNKPISKHQEFYTARCTTEPVVTGRRKRPDMMVIVDRVREFLRKRYERARRAAVRADHRVRDHIKACVVCSTWARPDNRKGLRPPCHLREQNELDLRFAYGRFEEARCTLRNAQDTVLAG